MDSKANIVDSALDSIIRHAPLSVAMEVGINYNTYKNMFGGDNMDRLNEFNTRLEYIVGVEAANNIFCDAEQRSYGDALELGVSVGSTEHLALKYQRILDGVLTHYEIKK